VVDVTFYSKRIHRMMRSPARLPASVLLAIGLLVALPSTPAAHEIPASVTVVAFVRPAGDRIQLLVRVPLESMRDMELPLRELVYLDFENIGDELRSAAQTWLVGYTELFENGERLTGGRVVAARTSLPADRSFASYTEALAHVRGQPIEPATQLPWNQALLDVLIEYPISSAGSDFSIDPRWAHLGVRTATVLRFLPPAGDERVLYFTGDPGLVHLDPGWMQSAGKFLQLGFMHILEGLDHLLFIFCLVIPLRRLRPLVVVVTSFTIAHSITLGAAALGLTPAALWFPSLIETLIAASIVYMALENIVGGGLQRRWILAFGFGLVHGFGFSFLLSESLQFAGSHLAMALLAFNLGVELGQILVLVIAIQLLRVLFRRVVDVRMGTIILSALVAHTAWHWMTTRGAEFMSYNLEMPAADLNLAADAMSWLALFLLAGGVLWLMYGLFERLSAPERMDGGAEPVTPP
jgi:hypothetical protein